MADIVGFSYAVVVAVGGVVGYVKAGSAMSLAMGLLFGGVAGYGASLTSQDPRNVNVILGSSAVLAGVMGMRFVKSGKFMPAGLVATLSILMVLRYGYRLTYKN
ncbi:transmembrane protein 14C-like isoform X1 [Anneissia japonica]|uniref:transmembrane protein 14C-like isoform X1 n=1 Tax=Anneissia japonica TaxID=1529436 RepID=UPI0014256312|nr:transmembrane protein 14C-like isoform X1 [Anneissia japonica]